MHEYVLAVAKYLKETGVGVIAIGRDEAAHTTRPYASLACAHGHQLADLLVRDV